MVNDQPASLSKPGSEVRTEDKNSVGPQQRLSRVAVPGNVGAVCASFGPLLSRGFFEPRRMSGGRFGSVPLAQDEWLSTEHTPPRSLPSPPTSLVYTQRRGRTLRQAWVWVFTSPHSPGGHHIAQGEGAVTNIIQSRHLWDEDAFWVLLL